MKHNAKFVDFELIIGIKLNNNVTRQEEITE
jgi:hypothetical protein